MFDLVIKGGTVVDGTGAPARVGDVAVEDGRVVEVGTVSGPAREVIDADGAHVTPGFVDPHTHYDGQATWDPYLSPSSWHGVTTAVFGNCGVGFAPVRPGKEEWLISVMEAVEDIPGSALSEGIVWGWESFPEYLDVLASLPHAIDVAAHVPHAAIRAYVMGERCTDEFDASDDELDAMVRIVRDSIDHGAVGFATSRTAGHMMLDGRPIPGTGAATREVLALASAARGSVVQLVPAGESGGMRSPNPETSTLERELIDAVARSSGARVTFSVLQDSTDPDNWRADFAMARRAKEDGFAVRPQVGGRCFGVLMGLQCKLNPLRHRPAYQRIAHLALAERVVALRDPALRDAILADRGPRPDAPSMDYLGRHSYDRLYALGGVPDYEPSPDRSVAAIAASTGRDPFDVVYDMLLGDDGRELLLFPMLNYSGGGYDGLLEMMSDPISLQGLSDGGAHCSMICDASIPTYMLSHWVRDRTRGPRIPIEYAIRRLALEPAQHYGFTDRGALTPGMRADFNVIDLDNLGMSRPEQVADLPADETRFVQRAHGYIATGVAGQVILRDGVETGAMPGRLVRGGGVTATAVPITERMGIAVPDDWAQLPEFAGSVAGDVRDPYPYFATMRREHPVAARTMRFGDSSRGEPVYEATSFWVYRRADVDAIMRNAGLFSNQPHRDSMGRVMGDAILIGMDEPEHRRHRALVSQAFRNKSIESWRTDKVAPIIDELIDRFAGRGYAELVSELTYRVPVQVIANILGVPRRDYGLFQEWAFLIHDFGSRPRAAMRAAAAMGEFLLEICEARRTDPREDVISDLVHAELDGKHLEDEEIIAFLRLLLPAGSDTTFRATGNLIYGLLTHPDQLAALTADRSLLKQAIEEGLRWETPLVVDARRATADTELSGVAIPAGSEVTMVLGSSNRDEAVYGDTGEDFDLFRSAPVAHLTFGVGVHLCLGLHLARIEMAEMVGGIVDALPGLHLDADWAREFDAHIHGEFFRSPTCLPVRWDPR